MCRVMNWHMDELGTRWTFGRAGPKNAAIEFGNRLSHLVFLEQTTEKGRRYGSYADVTAMETALGTVNHNVYEVITGACKPYFDVDAQSECLEEVLSELKAGYIRLFNEVLGVDDIMVSSATGSVGDHIKYSYHIVVNNNMHCACVEDAKRLRDHLFPERPTIDKAPYGRNQSFRLVFNSKLGSPRILAPCRSGTSYQQHMITCVTDSSQLLVIPALTPAPPRPRPLAPQPVAPQPGRCVDRLDG